jgi:methylated-DNA-protein-cysteine methyltransferase-like protein
LAQSNTAKEKNMKKIKIKNSKSLLSDLIEHALRKNTGSLSFYEKVYEIVRQIPKGKVTTYGAIAETIGMKSSSRLVGQALRSMPPEMGIPAWRVINHAGLLTGAHQFGGYERMRWLLETEGIAFKGDAVDMEKHFWKPKGTKR